jgi:hypothetical protein
MICIQCRTWLPDDDGDFCADCRPKPDPEKKEAKKAGEPTNRHQEILDYAWLRYGKESDVGGKRLYHFTDCAIGAKEVCTCGLLHDLAILPFEKASEVYEKFMEEFKAQMRAFDRMEKY